VGSEGTLGVITGARLRLHPVPRVEQRAAFGFSSFGDGIEACRRVLHRGATPAVLRLYDATEADRSYQTGDRHVLLALDEGYPDGACLYFTFAGQIEPDRREAYYRAAWDAGTRAVLAAGGALSHHHGVGLNRARFVREALGDAFDVLAAVKATLDPHGILNPGKLALPDPFGDVGWP